MNPFTYKVTKTKEVLAIEGNFQSGKALEAFKRTIVRKEAKGIYLILNLRNVTYMDSDSYRFVRKFALDSEVIWNRNSHVYKRYIDYVSANIR